MEIDPERTKQHCEAASATTEGQVDKLNLTKIGVSVEISWSGALK
jgi:hypothetical protein